MSGSSESQESTAYWIEWFLQLKGNDFFCEVDAEYLLDRFNLTGLNTEVPHYTAAFDLMTDSLDDDLPDETRAEIEASARHLYGLIHSRFILTNRGLQKMFEKVRHAEFGRCPRVLCHNQPVLPVGLSDVAGLKPVMLYCPRCEDIYTPPSRRHAAIDGAYFGTTFPHLFLQVYPQLVPSGRAGLAGGGPGQVERYVPKIFGFKIHSIAREHRAQDEIIEEQKRRLLAYQLSEE
ncbi:casein kinase II, regulatory subunit [Chytridium lagenaria]|nr:casein kinase II, regulatory subunit [Chytridium lagenaria]